MKLHNPSKQPPSLASPNKNPRESFIAFPSKFSLPEISSSNTTPNAKMSTFSETDPCERNSGATNPLGISTLSLLLLTVALPANALPTSASLPLQSAVMNMFLLLTFM
ncbi:hypothetical protein V8G54_022731 [Vigna mungo]|uniref:Uncharacterized protein n=1 Tax=Vigna mungo TaxID=3915 RepID=A0AAQ3N3L4_VIGMU